MTLKEKFYSNIPEVGLKGTYSIFNQHSINCEKIADDYAIDLLEWLTNEKSKFSIMYGNQEKRFSTIEEDYTAKELLEIFKKENKL